MFRYAANIALISLAFLLAQRSAHAQDTIPPETNRKAHHVTSSHRATMLAAALPGMGQIYNRKYWKIPIVYAGFAGIGYSAVFNSSNHVKFTRAYQDFIDLIPETDSYLSMIRGIDPATYDPVLHPESYSPSDAQWIKEQLMARIDYFKKYRDLSYIGIAAWYLVSILDAMSMQACPTLCGDNIILSLVKTRPIAVGMATLCFTSVYLRSF
jgi:hypothetical protein